MYKQSINKFCFVAFILFIKSLSCREDFLLIQKHHQYYCITNSSSALSWIRDNITDTVEPSSTFMVNSYTDNFEWKISINDERKLPREISKIWSLQKSLSRELTLDRRWEEMQVFNTDANKASHNFITVASELSENFIVHFSLRIARNAHIFLCDSANLNISNCYWLQMRAFQWKKTSVIKCSNTSIPFIANTTIRHHEHATCSKNLNFKKFEGFELHDEYLDVNKWLHFQITRSHNNFTLSQTTNELHSRIIIKFEDKEAFNVTHMIIHSGDVAGLWKVHELEYLFTKLETSNERLGPVIQVSNKYVCISMLVSMCEFCEIKLTLSVPGNLKQEIAVKKYQQLSRKWQEVKVTADRTTHKEVVLLVSTLSTSSQHKTHQFWNIDNIRQCQEHDEFRMITSKEKAKCQLVSLNNGNVLSPRQQSPGFFILGQIKNLTLIFKSPTTLLLNWKGPDSADGFFTQYTIIYQQLTHLSCKNNAIFEKKKIVTTKPPLLIHDLTPFSNYSFSILASNNLFNGIPQNVWQTTPADILHQQEIPDIEQITPNATYVEIKFSSKNCTKIRGLLWMETSLKCMNKWCQGPIHTVPDIFQRNSIWRLHHLIPFSNYTVNFIFFRNTTSENKIEIKRNFRTGFSAPNPVQGLLVYSKNESSISLRWKEPYPPTGVLSLYRTKYTGTENTSKEVTLRPLSCRLWHTYHCVTLLDLRKDQNYTIEVSAKNEECLSFGEKALIRAQTKIEASTPPYDLNLKWTLENDLELTWKHPNETNGDIEYFYIVLVTNSAPFSNTSHQFITVPLAKDQYKLTYHYKIEALKIHSSTVYTIKITAYNGIYYSKELKTTTVSPPSIPYFDSPPKIWMSSDVINIEIPAKVENAAKGSIYKLFLFVSDSNMSVYSHKELDEFIASFNISLPHFRIVYACDLSNLAASNLTVGYDHDGASDKCKKEPNPSLNANSPYNITLVLTNTYENMSRYKTYSFITTDLTTTPAPKLITTDLLTTTPAPTFIRTDLLTTTPVASSTNKKSLFSVPVLAAVIAVITLVIILIILCRIYILIRKKVSDVHAQEQIPLTLSYDRFTHNNPEIVTYSMPIKIGMYEDYVKKALQNGELMEQHETILSNASKKLYESIEKSLFWDYIDLHFVNGGHYKKAYIVTEMPHSHNLYEFWKMIWEENVKHIIFLDNDYDNERKKHITSCWPEKNKILKFGDIEVQLTFCACFADYDNKKFQITYHKEKREIEQIYLVSWSETSIPKSTLIVTPFFQKISQIPLLESAPILVLSGPSMQGAGFALLCNICLRTAKKDNTIDVLKNAQHLANCNVNLISNLKHYIFAHLVILENHLFTTTSISCESFDPKVPVLVSSKELQKYLNYMKNMLWLDEAAKRIEREVNSKCDSRLLINEEHEYDYIDTLNTVTVDGFRSPNKFIVTQQPTKFSAGYFWKLVKEKDVYMVVTLNTSEDLWWSNEEHPVLHFSENLLLKHKTTRQFKSYVWTTVDLHVHERKMSIELFFIRNWPAKSNCPEYAKDFVNFYIESNQLAKNFNPIIVTCNDGRKASGLYIALSYNIEKMKIEGVCDVCASVRIVKSQHQEFIKDDEQFTFLWEAAEQYLKEHQLYEIV